MPGGKRGKNWWCPNGCGKSIIYMHNSSYQCFRCKKIFNDKKGVD